MHNYIIVARKQDLADLVNYGEILVPLYSFIPYQGEFETIGGDNEVRKEAFAHVNPFSYTSSYVVLDVQTDEPLTGADEYRLDIQKVRHVAPLDRSGQTDMEISWGEGFKFSEPLWDSGVRDVFVANTARLARLGAHDMWDIFGIQEDIKPLDEKFSDDRIRRFCECVYDSMGHDKLGKWKEQNDMEWYLWLYLLRYERHQPWPEDTMGFVYDAANIFHNWFSGCDYGDGIRESPIIAFLDLLHSQKPDAKLSETLQQLSQKASDINDKNNPICGFVNLLGANGFLGTMVIFLLLKGRYVSNGNNLSKIKGTIQNVLDKAANFENGSGGLITAHSINMALYMLGLTITREGTGTEWYIKKGIGWVVPIPEKKPEPELQPMQTTYQSKANTRAAGKKQVKQTAKGKSGGLPDGRSSFGKFLKNLFDDIFGHVQDNEVSTKKKEALWAKLQSAEGNKQLIEQILDDAYRENGRADSCDKGLKARSVNILIDETTPKPKPKSAEQGTLQVPEAAPATQQPAADANSPVPAASPEQPKPASAEPAAQPSSSATSQSAAEAATVHSQTVEQVSIPSAESTPAPKQQAAQTPNATTPPATPPEGK